jgi:intein/homing endonuclease
MSRIPNNVLENVKRDISLGVPLNTISRVYGLAKSTLYYHYKKIKGKRYIEPYVIPTFSEAEGEIVGAFAGDGSQYHDRKRGHYEVRVHFGMHKLEYALHIQNLYSTYFKKEFRLSYFANGTIAVRCTSRAIYYYFSNYLKYDPPKKHCTVKLKTLEMPIHFKIGFLRGIVDTDGSVRYCKHGNRVRVAFYTTSRELHEQCRAILKELDIPFGFHTIQEEGFKLKYVIQLHQGGVMKFLEVIQPFKLKYLPSEDEITVLRNQNK